MTLYDNGAKIGTATVGSDGSWSASVTLSGDGAHSHRRQGHRRRRQHRHQRGGRLYARHGGAHGRDHVFGRAYQQGHADHRRHGQDDRGGGGLDGDALRQRREDRHGHGWQHWLLVGERDAVGRRRHSLRRQDTDAAGNTGTSAAVAYTLDTVAPTVAITSSGGLTNQATQTIAGTVKTTEAAAGSTVTLYDNGTKIGTATVDSNGSWSASVTLSGDGATAHGLRIPTPPATPARAQRWPTRSTRWRPRYRITSSGGLTNKASADHRRHGQDDRGGGWLDGDALRQRHEDRHGHGWTALAPGRRA